MSELSIADFDQVSASNVPFEFEVKRADGQPSGFFISILGDESDRVQKFTARKVNEDRRNNMLRAKKGKFDEYTPVESDIEFSVEACMVRAVGWRGVKEPFNAENARALFAKSRTLRHQIIEESANTANFTLKKDEPLSSTQGTLSV